VEEVVEEVEEVVVLAVVSGEADGMAEVPTPTTTTILGTPVLEKAVEHRRLLLAVVEVERSDATRFLLILRAGRQC
jgi:hypothetical protein